jgi:hypothetical protein
MGSRERKLRKLQAECDAFNATHKVGDEVQFWTGPREGDPRTGDIRAAAYVLGQHTPVVFIAGAGAVALTHVQDPPHDR